MRLYAYLNQNIDRIKREVCMGLMPCSILRHWEIYSRYDAYKKMQNTTVNSVLNTAQDMRVSERVVFKIIKRMETEI
jgi:predicted sugar kinase